MPFSQKCFIRSSCARIMTSDPDLEAKTRFSPRSILDDSFQGEGVALWRGVVGSCPGCPEEGEGVEGGWWHPASVTCPGGAGYKVLPWSDLMIRVGRPWISCFFYWALDLLRCCTRQGPIQLLHVCGTIPE
jgi:hypothetical protein